MDQTILERKDIKPRRLTPKRLENVFSRVKKARDYLSEIEDFHSKKILALVADNPKLGHKTLSDALELEGISIAPIYIYRFLVKHNLNRKSFRMAWKDCQEATKKETKL